MTAPTETPRPTCPPPDAVVICWLKASSKYMREALYPMVDTLEMLLPMTVISSP
jgi:hypothetical protein